MIFSLSKQVSLINDIINHEKINSEYSSCVCVSVRVCVSVSTTTQKIIDLGT